MQYISTAALAFALGASAHPQWPTFSFAPPAGPSGGAPPPPPGSGASSSAAGVSYSIPLGTGVSSSAEPVGTGCEVSYIYPSSSAAASVPPVSLPSPISVSTPAGSGIVSSGYNYPAASGTGESSGFMTILPITPSSLAAPASGAPSSAAPSGGESSYAPSAVGSAPAGSVTTSVAAPSGDFGSGGSLPASSGTSSLSAVQTIAAGDSFDCGMVMYDRGVSCTGQDEGGDSDAVFILENGASLSNCIIGPNQIEGVHCEGACSLTNVWWSAVCEDAFTIKEQAAGETTTITGGGAYGAEDKVLQHNGGGTLSVSGFTVDGFGKVYRSCGNCDEMYERHVIFDDLTAVDGSQLAGINSNYGDTATFSNIKVSDVSDICVEYEGNDTGDEPEEISSGPSSYCIYSDSDVTTA